MRWQIHRAKAMGSTSASRLFVLERVVVKKSSSDTLELRLLARRRSRLYHTSSSREHRGGELKTRPTSGFAVHWIAVAGIVYCRCGMGECALR